MRVAVLEFRSEEVTRIDIDNVESLNDYWNAASSSECSHRLLVEDLSVPWVNAFGSHFNLDPSLFVSYAYTPNRSKIDDRKMVRGLPSAQHESAAFTLKYYEARRFNHEAPDPTRELVETKSNIPRELAIWTSHFKTMQPRAGLVRRNCSFWLKKDCEASSWNGKQFCLTQCLTV